MTTAAPGSTTTGIANAPDFVEYKVKLLGLLPDGYKYANGPTRWDLSTACVCKIPSEMTVYDGKMDKKGHPTLIGSGILERKYGLTVQLPTIAESERAASGAQGPVKDEEDDDEEYGRLSHHHHRGPLNPHDDDDDDFDAILEEEEDCDGSGNESGSEGSRSDEEPKRKSHLPPNFICHGCQQTASQSQRDNLMTKWLKNNFDPRRDSLPDIVCRRTVLTYIMTQKQPFILNAKKISFVSTSDPERKEHTVIHVEFDYLPLNEFDMPGGERFRSTSSKTPDEMPTSEKNFDAESYYEKPNLIGYFGGKLSCKIPSIQPENRTIRILLSAIVDGLWQQKDDPEFYKTTDLAEIKNTMETTVYSDPKLGGNPHFFKQVRMAHAWAQCHLVGISRMMVGVHSLVPGTMTEEDDEPAYALTSKPRKILQELWLYDVEKMPTAVKISSVEDSFRGWTPNELKWKLFTALLQIKIQVQNSAEGITHRFLHYYNEDFLVPMSLQELQLEWRAIHEANRTLIFRNVHIPQTSPGVIELSMEEVEQEHAEKQVDFILNTFLCLGIPIETVKVNRVVGVRKELEIIFLYEGLARRVYHAFRIFVLRNRYLPRGLEKLRIEPKRTKRCELERMRRKGTSQQFVYLIPNPDPNYNMDHFCHGYAAQHAGYAPSSSKSGVYAGQHGHGGYHHHHHHRSGVHGYGGGGPGASAASTMGSSAKSHHHHHHGHSTSRQSAAAHYARTRRHMAHVELEDPPFRGQHTMWR